MRIYISSAILFFQLSVSYSFAQTDSQSIQDHLNFLEAESKLASGDLNDAERLFKLALQDEPNQELRNRTHLHLVEILISKKKLSEASRQLSGFEKKLRGTVLHPQSLFLLAQVQIGLRAYGPFCKSIRKLYSRYPTFSQIENWGLYLPENIFLGKKTNCSASSQDMKQRIRFLQFAGESEKLKSELEEAQQKKYLSEAEWTSTEVAYLVSEGEVAQALKLLSQKYENRKNEFGYLNQLGSIAARAGEGAMAIGSYYRAYQMSPKSKKGREALYQSAFLSYQFQDYDGAAQKFSEFMTKFPSSKLSRDADWQLAWIRYLKGDYFGTLKDLERLGKIRKQKQGDRIIYWKAMAHFRLGQIESAYKLFSRLASKKYLDFYAESAKQRINEIEKMNVVSKNTTPKSSLAISDLKKLLNSNLYSLPREDIQAVQFDEYSEDYVELPTFLETAITGDEEGLETPENSENLSEDIVAEEAPEKLETPEVVKEIEWSSKKVTQKFKKVQALVQAGLIEFAQSELREVERKSRSLADKKILVEEYERIQNYNRSSIIAGDNLKRSMSSIEAWKKTYPMAYEKIIREQAKNYDIPAEFIWGIMRAESSYRSSAISPVGAMGLMQIMPNTGKKMAEMANKKDFSPSMLLQPEVSIQLGSKYLQRLLKKFDNEVALAAAAYNAGPHRVKTWLSLFGDRDLDEFIEHIPFIETRNYVKRVVANTLIYKNLYGEKWPRRTLNVSLNKKLNFEFKGQAYTKETWEEL